MTKRTTEKSKSATPSTHPEVQPSRTKAGVPGTESSKSGHSAKDVRSGDDKDGNSEQHSR
jgi:hypothetical protein